MNNLQLFLVSVGVIAAMTSVVWAIGKLRRTLHRTRDVGAASFPGPSDCPRCCGRLEREGDLWVCRGTSTRAEVEQFLIPRRPHGHRLHGVTATPPCGFEGSDTDYGTKWA